MEIWYGKPVADKIYEEIQHRRDTLISKGVQPGLGLLLVGNDPASEVYVRMKYDACQKYGIHSEIVKLPHDASKEEVAKEIYRFNGMETIHGFIIQLPLPSHLPTLELLNLVTPSKDVDCLTAENLGKLIQNIPTFLPCTPAGILALLEYYGVELVGKRILVIGRSNIVGRPISILLSQKGYDSTVTLAHSKTLSLKSMLSEFDGVIAAIGSPEYIDSRDLKPDSWVVDVGVNRVVTDSEKKYKLIGDVRIDEHSKLYAYTPVPGGVGPLTIANLLKNCVIAASRRVSLQDI